MVAVEKDQPATIQNANEPVRDVPKLSEWRSAVLNPFVQQASFSPTVAASPDTFIIVKASTQKED